MGASRDIKIISDNINEIIRVAFNRTKMKKIGDEMTRLIVLRTRLGFGVSRDGEKREKLPKLADASLYIRQKKKKEGNLDSSTTPKKSNLTQTGQLLNSIKVKTYADGTVKIGPSGYRDDGMSNEYLANKLQSGVYSKQYGLRQFNFLFLSKLQQKQIIRFIENDFNSLLRRKFR